MPVAGAYKSALVTGRGRAICFSATASFSAAAALLVVGAVTVRRVRYGPDLFSSAAGMNRFEK